MTNKTEDLAREILRECDSFPNNDLTPFGLACKQLARMVIDGAVCQTPKGERMPQTPEQFAYVANKYEEALLREKEENSRLRVMLNESRQKCQKAKKEQRDKDARYLEIEADKIGDLDDGCNYSRALKRKAKTIREG